MTENENILSVAPMTRARAADVLNCSERTVDRLMEGGYLTRYDNLKASPTERAPILLWEWEVLQLRDARVKAGKQQ
jgi:hypothetical protein